LAKKQQKRAPVAQICNTSLHQRRRRRIDHLRGSTTCLNKACYSAVISNAETSAKYQLSSLWCSE